MQLIYRGTTYDHDSLRASSHPVRRETPYNLHYRGTTYHVTPNSETVEGPVQTIARQLIYRGTTYWVTRTVAAVASTSTDASAIIIGVF